MESPEESSNPARPEQQSKDAQAFPARRASESELLVAEAQHQPERFGSSWPTPTDRYIHRCSHGRDYSRVLVKVGEQSRDFLDRELRNLSLRHMQSDEIERRFAVTIATSVCGSRSTTYWRIHGSLRMTPAMKAGIVSRRWNFAGPYAETNE
jgi:hypothetical protein